MAEVERLASELAALGVDAAKVGRPLDREGRLREFDILGGRELSGISLLVDEAGTSFEGWSLPEVEVWVPDRGAGG